MTGDVIKKKVHMQNPPQYLLQFRETDIKM